MGRLEEHVLCGFWLISQDDQGLWLSELAHRLVLDELQEITEPTRGSPRGRNVAGMASLHERLVFHRNRVRADQRMQLAAVTRFSFTRSSAHRQGAAWAPQAVARLHRCGARQTK